MKTYNLLYTKKTFRLLFNEIKELEATNSPLMQLYNSSMKSILLHEDNFQISDKMYFHNKYPKLDQIVLQHTSHRVLDNIHAVIPVLYAFQSLVPSPSYKFIYSKTTLNAYQVYIQQKQRIGIQMSLKNIYLIQFLKDFKQLINHIQPSIHNTYNQFSINNFISILTFEKDYDSIIALFKNLRQFGCKISIPTYSSNKTNSLRLLYLYHLFRY